MRVYILFLLLLSVSLFPVSKRQRKRLKKRNRVERRYQEEQQDAAKCCGLKPRQFVRLAQTSITAGVSVSGTVAALIIAIISATAG